MIVALSTVLIGLAATAIGGYLVLGENPRAVALLKWLYRWPLFIPFVVAGQLMRTFLAKNGMMNNTLVGMGILEPLQAQSFLDWRGIVITFVWKQTPFVALLVSGAMASLDRSTIEAARNLGAGRLRILFEIVVPQVRHDPGGRPDPLLRHHDVGALGAAHDQRPEPHHAHRRHGLPHQLLR